jgi:hypothetical protein
MKRINLPGGHTATPYFLHSALHALHVKMGVDRVEPAVHRTDPNRLLVDQNPDNLRATTLLHVSDLIICLIQIYVGFLMMWRRERRMENEVVVSRNNCLIS